LVFPITWHSIIECIIVENDLISNKKEREEKRADLQQKKLFKKILTTEKFQFKK
jgi:hypothetical protein